MRKWCTRDITSLREQSDTQDCGSLEANVWSHLLSTNVLSVANSEEHYRSKRWMIYRPTDSPMPPFTHVGLDVCGQWIVMTQVNTNMSNFLFLTLTLQQAPRLLHSPSSFTTEPPTNQPMRACYPTQPHPIGLELSHVPPRPVHWRSGHLSTYLITL